MIQSLTQPTQAQVSCRLIGAGGMGKNALAAMALDDTWPVQKVHVDTDVCALEPPGGITPCLIGQSITRGLGTGAEVSLGQAAALASQEDLAALCAHSPFICLIGGLGGGTAAGVLPYLANLAAQQNAFTLAFVAMPFHLEGKRKREQAEEALSVLRSLCHGVVVVPNDLLLQQLDSHATALQAFELANDWIYRALKAIFKVLFTRGYIQLSPQTLQQVLSHKGGKTLFALGQAKGENYVQAALQDLVLCPLLYTLEQSRKADHIALHMIAGSDLPLSSISAILSFVSEHFHALGKTCLGVFLDPCERQSLELCVLGSVDTEASGYSLALAGKGVGLKNVNQETSSDAIVAPDLVRRAFVPPKSDGGDLEHSVAQAEFTFVSQGHMRGFFDTSDKNAFQGEDLDVPTYLRRGIKLAL